MRDKAARVAEMDDTGIPTRRDGLQIDEHTQLQRRVWIFQRANWIAMLGIVGLALIGLTGNGGLLSQDTAKAGPDTITGSRISRRSSMDRMTVMFGGDQPVHKLWLGSAFFAGFHLESVSPPPTDTRLSGGGQIMEFVVEGPGPHMVALTIQPWAMIAR